MPPPVDDPPVATVLLRYDLRRAPHSSVSAADQYAACLEQVRWGERVGVSRITLSEHHGTDDGYLPSPVTLAAAVAGATERVAISIAALLVTMHDPVRLAEQLAVLDLVSRGRVSVVAGTGYREDELAMAGISFADRFRVLEEHITVLRQAWTGEWFEWQGRRIRVTPMPATPGGPILLLAGSSVAAARRAARLRMWFSPALDDPEVLAAYAEECERVGFSGLAAAPSAGLPAFVHVTDDPERDWARIGPYAAWDAATYASWQRRGQTSAVHVDVDTLDELRASGTYRVVTPDDALDLARSTGVLLLHPLMGGIPPDLAAESLDLVERAVLPHLALV